MISKSALWKVTGVLAALAMAFSLGFSSTTVLAQTSPRSPWPIVQPDNGTPPAVIDKSLATAKGPVNVIVEMAAKPTTVVYAEAMQSNSLSSATVQATQALQQIKSAQDQLTSTLQGTMNAQVIYSVQRVYNGVAVRVDASQLKAIARLSGVKAIHPLIPKTLSNFSSVPLIGAPEAWLVGLGTRGEGIKVGIIDTGIDYLHTDFGGPGTPEAYANNDPTVVGDAPNYPSVKVAGGYDFAGDDYNADNSTDPNIYLPKPDFDPMDCAGHGSHVSGTTAGYGVNADGTTYTGPYGPAMPFDTLGIGPGVAPDASIYMLKVFGCSGSTNLADMGLEWAADPNGDGDFSDHLDVVNMSLGSPYGNVYDSTAVAAENATKAGVVVVASAGNESDAYYIVGSPSTANSVISVASSSDGRVKGSTEAIMINTPASIAGLVLTAPAAFGGTLADLPNQTLTGDVAYQAANDTACDPYTGTPFDGKIALIYRGTCSFDQKSLNAQNAGAIGVLIANNQPGLVNMGAATPSIADQVTVPVFALYKTDGDKMKAEILAGHTVNVTASAGPQPGLVDTLSSFTSRGPRSYDSFLKPDLTAPGQSIFSVASGTGTEGEILSGTSMAAPHVTGMMALLKQLHPTWTVEELKALAMNTANHDLYTGFNQTGDKYEPSRVGAGRVDAAQAATDSVIMYNTDVPGTVSVSFGQVEVSAKVTQDKHVTVVNKGKDTATYDVTFDDRSQVGGVSFTLLDKDGNALSSLTLKAGESASITVRMTANPAKMTHDREKTVAGTLSLDRAWLSEASGLIMLTPAKGDALRLPVLAVARPVSDMSATPKVIKPGTTGSVSLTLAGKGVDTSSTTVNPPLAEQSLVDVLQLAYTSPNDDMGTGDPVFEKILDTADLQYVGVMSNAPAYLAADPASDLADAMISFGVSTYAPWPSPNQVEFDIYIDVNKDGTDDFVIYNTYPTTAASDDFITVLYNFNTGQSFIESYLNGVDPAEYDMRTFNTNVVTLPVFLTDLGLSPTDASFNFQVVSFSSQSGNYIDITPYMPYDAVAPAISLPNVLTKGVDGLPVFMDQPAEKIDVNYDFAAAKPDGILLLHRFNMDDQRAELVNFLNTKIFLPHVAAPAAP